LGASTNRIFFNLFFDDWGGLETTHTDAINAPKAESLENLLVTSLAIVTLVNDLAHCEPVTNAVNAFEDVHASISIIGSVVNKLFPCQASDVVLVGHGDILL
tara:strand:+ start:521 stop:826 length:306 start_codon:yes stop_codon:yes gene_type:complete